MAVPLLGTSLMAFALGWLGRYAYVIGMSVMGLGLTAGALSAVASLGVSGTVRRPARWLAVVAVIVGWVGLQWMDDVQFRSAFRYDFAAAGFADSGAAADEAITEDDIAFFGEDAEHALEEQVVAAVGFGGVTGRWLFRADAGVRLVGPWHSGRGIAVGRVGAILWAVAEVSLALLLAATVLARVRRRRGQVAPQPT